MDVRFALARILTGMLILGGSNALAQLPLFLEHLPAQGDWAEIIEESAQKDGSVTRETLRISVTGSDTVGGVAHLWFEFSPIKFIGPDKGTLRLLIKAQPSAAEIADPLVMAQKLMFQAPGKKAILLERKTIQKAVKLAGSLRMDVKKQKVGDAEIDTPAGRRATQRYDFSSSNRVNGALTAAQTVTYSGVLWEDLKVPFGVAKADLTTTKVKKGKTSTRQKSYVLSAFGRGTAVTGISGPVEEMGILELLLAS